MYTQADAFLYILLLFLLISISIGIIGGILTKITDHQADQHATPKNQH